jgi:penicillin-binding protein 1A
VEDSSGNILEQFTPNPQQVLPKNTALTISNILSDDKARTPTFGAHSVLYIPGRDVAVKTGTTNNNKDAWTIGYNPNIAVGVWAGNNDNVPMKKGGAALAGPIWNKFITAALQTVPDERFEKPNPDVDPTLVKPVLRGFWQGNENFFIDKISGKLATPNTPKEALQEKVVTNVHSILYWVDKNNITGPPPANPSNDPQFDHWEVPVQKWWAQNSNKYPITTWAEKPTALDDIHTNASKPVVSIVSPNGILTYSPTQKIAVQVSSSGPYAITKMDIFVNDTYLGTSTGTSTFSFTPNQVGNIQTDNELKVIVYDTVYNSSEATASFKVQ